MSKKKKSKKGRAALLALAVVAVGAGALATGISIRDRSDASSSGTSDHRDDGGPLDVIWQNGARPIQAEVVTNRNDETGQTTVTIPYTVEPEGTTFKDMTVEVKWEDETVQDPIAETMAATIDNDAKTVTLTGLKDFSNFVVCNVRSSDDSSIGFSIRCHCAQRFMGFDQTADKEAGGATVKLTDTGTDMNWGYIRSKIMNDLTGGKGTNLSTTFTPGDAASIALPGGPNTPVTYTFAPAGTDMSRIIDDYSTKMPKTKKYMSDRMRMSWNYRNIDETTILTLDGLKTAVITDIGNMTDSDKNKLYKVGSKRTFFYASYVYENVSVTVSTHAGNYSFQIKSFAYSFRIDDALNVLNNYGAVPLTSATAESTEVWF